jgi:spermidine/putrescine transport system permease protein
VIRAIVLLLLLSVVVFYWAMARRERQRFSSAAHVGFIDRNGFGLAVFLVAAATLWIVVMIVLPQLYMVDFSFRYNLPPADIGGPKDVYTLKNYRYLLFGPETDPGLLNWLHLTVFVRTILISVAITIFNFLLCYPIAYILAQVAKGRQVRILAICLILPFWVNEILRAFAFRILFGTSGFINEALIASGILDQPIDFLRADVGVYAGLSYAYLLMMMFPLYNAIESLDHNQIEAARDLGAPWWHIHLFVVMPFAKPGIASGCTMVFMLCAGALAAPQILGGPSSLWFTQIIYDWFYQGFNWPQGSAYAFALLVACIAFMLGMMKLFKVGLGEIAK